MVARSAYPKVTEEEFLTMGFTMIDWVKALRSAFDITVVVSFWRDRIISIDGVDIHFIKDKQSTLHQKFNTAYYKRIQRITEEKNIDVLHIHNLGDPITIQVLSQYVDEKIKIIVQDHGSLPLMRHRLLSSCYRNVSTVLFCSNELEKNWVKAGILNQEQCYFILENSSSFKYIDRQQARQKTGLKGNPILLWVGNLIPLKDPLIVIGAIEKLRKKYPDLILYMIYRREEILEEVQLKIEALGLDDHVKLLGAKDRRDLELYYNSADIFISASHKEGSGYTAIEAMSCGCIPILTDIPSFRMLTNQGTIGRLWRINDSDGLITQIGDVLDHSLEEQSQSVLNFFNKELSFKRIFSDYLSLCKQLLN